MLAVPAWAREFLLKYGLLTPSGYQAHYSDVATLLACATEKQKKKVSVEVKEGKSNGSVDIVSYEDLTVEEQAIHNEALEISTEPFNDDESIIKYIGSGGKTFFWWISTKDFNRIFTDFNGGLKMNGEYVEFQGQLLHLRVMGRRKLNRIKMD
jgi:hypothetical protein